jgi:zinc transport system substrate-binding protein
MNKRWIGILGAGALVLAACGDDGAAGEEADGGAVEGATEVVASFYPLVEAAQRVGGDRVSVTNLTPAGVDPHDVEIDPRQVDTILGADLAVVMGRGFQPAVERVADDRDGATVEVLRALDIDQEGEVADHDHGHGDDEHGEDGHAEDDHADDGHGHGEDEHADDEHADDEHDEERGGASGGDAPLDPHVWLDPTKMAAIVDEVAAALVEADPDGAEEFEANAEAYREELAELDDSFEDGLSDCRLDLVVVQHEAFGWMADRYGFRQEGIAGLSPEQEPNPRRMAELVDLVQDEGVEIVFTETLASPRIAETLAREAGVETRVLNPLEGLADEQVEAGETYLSLMEENRDALVEALDCS